jgi:hypothetical protein
LSGETALTDMIETIGVTGEYDTLCIPIGSEEKNAIKQNKIGY